MTMLYFQIATDEVRAFQSIEEAQRFGCHEYPRLTHEEAVAWASPLPPSPVEIRKVEMSRAASQAQHFDMMGDAEQAAAWRGYYRELYAMSESPEWPMIELWPTPPDGLG